MARRKKIDTPVVVEAPKVKCYVVAPGKAIVLQRGVAGPGTMVDASVIAGGEKSLMALVEKGYILEIFE